MATQTERFKPYVSGAYPCALCGRPIRMIRTEADKSMPVDADLITVTAADTDEGLPVRLVDRMGVPRIHLEGEAGFMPHFGTCPEYVSGMPLPRGAEAAPSPTRRSRSHLVDRMEYLDEALDRIYKMQRKGLYEAKHLTAALRQVHKYIKRTIEIIEEE